MSGLTEEQWELYDKLWDAITDRGKVAELLKGVSKDDLLVILTTHEQLQNETLTPLGHAMKYSGDQEVVKVILDAAKEHNILKEVLTNTNITEKFNGKEDIFTPLGLAIRFTDQEMVKVILDAAKEHNILKEVLTNTNITEKFNGKEDIFTPLGLAIRFTDQEMVKVILDAAKEHNILKEVLTTANIHMKFPNGIEYTRTPLGLAICLAGQKVVKVILDAAKEHNILEEVLAGIGKNDRERIKGLLNPSSSKNVEQPQTNKAKTTNKPIIIGSVCGVIAGLAVGVGCFAFGVALPILAIAGVALASALLVGLIAGGITYAVSKPNSVTDNPDMGNLGSVNKISS